MGKSVSIPKRVFHLLSSCFYINDCILATEVGSVSCDTCSSFQATPLRCFCPVHLPSVDSQPVITEAGQISVLIDDFHLVCKALVLWILERHTQDDSSKVQVYS